VLVDFAAHDGRGPGLGALDLGRRRLREIDQQPDGHDQRTGERRDESVDAKA
jgi:hypothetical protein